MNEVSIQTPRVFKPLLQPSRYKGSFGGRGSGKSHFFAELVIERCLLQKSDVVCVREIQRTLKQSVKKLLESKIRDLGVSDAFRITDKEIHTPFGGIIIFEGMQSHTADSIKSLEGFDVAWVEEAHSLSQRSLDLLRPTIRRPGSELWFTWNPNLETDPVDRLLRGETPPPGAIVVEANYRDNPWFPDELKKEMEYDRDSDPDKFAHIWLGQYQRNSEARVFKNWTVEEFERPAGTVYRLGADWGFAKDPSTLVRCSVDGNRLYVDYEAYMIGCEIVNLPDLFDRVPESRKWFITADSARPETISYMQSHGFPKVNPAVKGKDSVNDGVEFLKSYDIVVHPRCQHMIDELTLYSYKKDRLTGSILPILEDKGNHCLVAGTMVETCDGPKPIESVTTQDRVLTRAGYKRVLFSGVTGKNRQIVRIKTLAGDVVCTPDHEIYTSNRGFIRADALRYTDEVITFIEEPQCQSILNTTARLTNDTRKANGAQIVCTSNDQHPPGRYGFIGRFGKTLTVLFQKVATFTTRTITPLTMSYQTLSAYPSALTLKSIGLHNDTNASLSILTKFARSQKRGMQAPKVLPSIEKLEQKPMQILSPCRKGANNAMVNLSQEKSGTSIAFVQTSASRPIDAIQAPMTNCANARNAGRTLRAINTENKQLARARVLTVTEAGVADKVYDLTIEGQHEFFANGILVHNCIDALRYALEGVRKTPQRTVRRVEYVQTGTDFGY